MAGVAKASSPAITISFFMYVSPLDDQQKVKRSQSKLVPCWRGASGRTSLRLRTGEGYARPAPCRRLIAGHRVTRYAAPILKVWGTGDRGLRPSEGRHAL